MRHKKIIFPPVSEADQDGLVYVGGDLQVDNLLAAYSQGIFPWPQPGLPILWFAPSQRGILHFDDLHIPKSLKRVLKQHHFKATFDQAFERVVRECSRQTRPGQFGTWITEEMIKAYVDFHQAGYAHSVEVWLEKPTGDELVGGLYGVYVQGVFSGESMFHKVPNASKVALLEMIKKLQSVDLEWMDIQMLTPVTEQLGGVYVHREDYMLMLADAQAHFAPKNPFS